MSRVVWTPVAQSDLDDILFYIAYVDRNPLTGERIYYEIRDRVLDHAERMLPGQKHPSAPEGWLYLRHKRWLNFYQQHPSEIEVMRVIDAVRDLPRQFHGLYSADLDRGAAHQMLLTRYSLRHASFRPTPHDAGRPPG